MVPVNPARRPAPPVPVDLADEERQLLVAGLRAWGDCPTPTDALAAVLGFAGGADLQVTCARLAKQVDQRKPLLSADWTRALLATEVVFASDVVGMGRAWSAKTGLDDQESVLALRSLQGRLTHAGVVNHGAIPAAATKALTPGVRRSARVLIFDGRGRLVVIRRSKPGREPTLITPGGRRNEDETIAQAARRWARTQIGAELELGVVAHVDYQERPTRKVTHVFSARLVSLKRSRAVPPEDGSTYEVVHLRVKDPALAELRPAPLGELMTSHGRLVARQAPPRHRTSR